MKRDNDTTSATREESIKNLLTLDWAQTLVKADVFDAKDAQKLVGPANIN